MSGGPACQCVERQQPIEERAWEWLQYKGNRSAFNGYRWTPSDYSTVRCRTCGSVWRTKANWPLKETTK